jgi:hypothetical protein
MTLAGPQRRGGPNGAFDEGSAFRQRASPAGDQPGEGVDHERAVAEPATIERHVSEIGHMQGVGPRRPKAPPHQIRCVRRSRITLGAAHLVGAHRAAPAVGAHDLLHPAAGHRDALALAVIADGLAELQIRWPNVPIVFCETRQLAEEWTYRFLAAAHVWAIIEHAALQRISPTRIDVTELDQAAAAPEPSTAEVRAWARAVGLPVPDRGRLRPDIWQAWHDANDAN